MHLLKNTSDVFLDRVINKFKEKEFEKIERLFEIYKFYQDEAKEIEKEYADEEKLNVLKEFQQEIVFIFTPFSSNFVLGKRGNNLPKKIGEWARDCRICGIYNFVIIFLSR